VEGAAEGGAEGSAPIGEMQQLGAADLNAEEEARARELEEQERKLAEIQEK